MSFDRGLSIGLFLFSIWTLYLSTTMKLSAVRQIVNADVFPIIISISMMLAAVALFFKSLKEKPIKAHRSELPEGVTEDRKTQVLAMLGIGAYVFAMEPLGYMLSTALLTIYETAVFEAKHWVRNLLSGVGFSLFVYITFVHILRVLLPKGALETILDPVFETMIETISRTLGW